MNSAQAERNLQQGDIDLATCDAKRQLAIDAWPQPVETPNSPLQPR